MRETLTKKEKLKLAEKRKTSYQELYCTRSSKTTLHPTKSKGTTHLESDANPASVYEEMTASGHRGTTGTGHLPPGSRDEDAQVILHQYRTAKSKQDTREVTLVMRRASPNRLGETRTRTGRTTMKATTTPGCNTRQRRTHCLVEDPRHAASGMGDN